MSRPIFLSLAPAVFAATLCLATAASAQEGGSPLSVFERMFGGNNQAQPNETTGQVPESATDQVLRIERLEAQIRQLTGTIEQLQYRNRQLEDYVRRVQGGGSPPPGGQAMRPPGPVGSGPVGSVGPVQAPSPQVAAIPGHRSDVFDPTQHPNAPGVPRTLGGLPVEPPAVITAEPQIGAPGGQGPGSPLDLSTLATAAPNSVTAPGQPAEVGLLPPPPSRHLSGTGAVASVAPPSESPKDYYDLGYGYVLRKDYALAETTFEAFLKKFPSDKRAGDAQFWLGESQFQRQRYDNAAQAFLDLSTKHVSHPKAAEAMLRLGQSLAALHQKEMACATLAEAKRKYPRASPSVRQGIDREQKRVHC